MNEVAPGSRWLDQNPRHVVADWRRVIEVLAADEHGFVEGVGWWQQRDAYGEWVDQPRIPGSRRRTRIRTSLFVKRYVPLDSAPTSQI